MKISLERYFVLICCIVLMLTACGPRGYIYHGGGKISRKQFNADQQEFQPYRDRNTLEAYQEFLRTYPSNSFWKDARDKIEFLEFKPYEKLDTVEGYLEFKMLYPRNQNIKKANWRIEQVEIRRYDNLDTIAGYREFIEKYPDSIFVTGAHERLEELTFRKQDQALRKKYGFDLLKYRYAILKAGASYEPLWNFKIFAYIGKKNGKPVFINRLLYSTLPNLQDETVQKKVKEIIISSMLSMIASQGNPALRLPQPTFEICHAPGGINANAVPRLGYGVQHNSLRQLAAKKKSPSELLIISQVKPAPAASSSTPIAAPHTDTRPDISYLNKPTKKVVRPPAGPVEIMQRVANSNSFTDALLSRRWETAFSDGRTKTVSVIEKHRNYGSHERIKSARVLRYLATKDTRNSKRKSADAILLQRSHKGKERYWYIYHRGDPGRTLNIGQYRHDAENNFFLEQYVDPPVESETHKLVAMTTYRNRPAAIIKSTPKKKTPYYTWRNSTIDRERMVPLMIEYYNKQGAVQKNVTFTSEQRFGIWYWDTARFENLENGSITRIKTTDIRINIGLHTRDFHPGALPRLTGR